VDSLKRTLTETTENQRGAEGKEQESSIEDKNIENCIDSESTKHDIPKHETIGLDDREARQNKLTAGAEAWQRTLFQVHRDTPSRKGRRWIDWRLEQRHGSILYFRCIGIHPVAKGGDGLIDKDDEIDDFGRAS